MVQVVSADGKPLAPTTRYGKVRHLLPTSKRAQDITLQDNT